MIYLTDVQRMQYLDGTADAEVSAFIVNSAYERARVAALANALTALHKQINPHACPKELALGEYFLDTLAFEESVDIALHVQNCIACQQRLKNLACVLDVEQRQRLFLYPDRVQNQGLVVTRSVGTVINSTYSFHINEAEINLSFRQSRTHRGHTDLWGLLTGLEIDTPLSAELRPINNGASVSTAIQSLGEFSFTQITNGEYELVIRSDTIDYVLRNIVIG